MVHLSWNMARNIKVSDHKLFEMIKWAPNLSPKFPAASFSGALLTGSVLLAGTACCGHWSSASGWRRRWRQLGRRRFWSWGRGTSRRITAPSARRVENKSVYSLHSFYYSFLEVDPKCLIWKKKKAKEILKCSILITFNKTQHFIRSGRHSALWSSYWWCSQTNSIRLNNKKPFFVLFLHQLTAALMDLIRMKGFQLFFQTSVHMLLNPRSDY